MLDEQFIVFGAAVNLLVGLQFVAAVVRGQARPRGLTWLIWSTAAGIALAGQLDQGAGLSALLTLTVALVASLVFLACLVRRGNGWAATRLDGACVVGAVAAIILLLVASGEAAIIAGIAVHALGAVPGVITAVRHPEAGPGTVYAGGMVAAACVLLAQDQLSVANSAFALYFLALCAGHSALRVIPARLIPARLIPARLIPARLIPARFMRTTKRPEAPEPPPAAQPPTRGPGAAALDPAFTAAVAAFAASFVVDWASVDPQRRAERRARLQKYWAAATTTAASAATAADEATGRPAEPGLVHQTVGHVFTGAVTPTERPGAFRVEIRLLTIPYLPDLPAADELATAAHADSEPHLPGLRAVGPPPESPPRWRALKLRARDPRWQLLHVEVIVGDNTMAIDPDSIRVTPLTDSTASAATTGMVVGNGSARTRPRPRPRSAVDTGAAG